MRRDQLLTAARCAGAGLLLCASLPPWGWWPLAFAGVVLLDRVLADRPALSRFRRGTVVGLALLAPSMAWIKELTLPGYLIAVAYYSLLLGVFLLALPPGAGRRFALPGVWVLWEACRSSWPFGGVPLSVLSVGQVGGPLAPLARLGGSYLIGFATVTLGVALAALVDEPRRLTEVRHVAGPVAAVVAVVGLVGLAVVVPRGHDTGRTIRVALVQGGGPQGTRAIDTDPRDVFDRHLKASREVPPGMDLVVWPEDVVDTPGPVQDYEEGDLLSALARRLDTTLVVGVVEDVGKTKFANASVVYDRNGDMIARYDKVHRVPFGEWVPFRSLIEKVAPAALTARDAVAGTDQNTLQTPAGRLGVVISWEVFFGHRARDAIRGDAHGQGQVLLNPTNGSSFSGTLVQTQQVASSRLRAIETGRWEAQVAPTGFSAFVTPEGTVLERTDQSDPAVIVHDVALREGLTPYVRWGEWPTLALTVLSVAVGWLVQRRDEVTPPAAA